MYANSQQDRITAPPPDMSTKIRIENPVRVSYGSQFSDAIKGTDIDKKKISKRGSSIEGDRPSRFLQSSKQISRERRQSKKRQEKVQF